MKLISKFMGEVQCGFVGNIQFNQELNQKYQELYIVLSYKEGKTDVMHSEILLPKIEKAWEEYTGKKLTNKDVPDVLKKMKTEIQLCAFINEDFLGNVHKPGNIKEMLITDKEATAGCMTCSNIQGHLRVIINFFQVISKDVTYTLSIYGKEDD